MIRDFRAELASVAVEFALYTLPLPFLLPAASAERLVEAGGRLCSETRWPPFGRPMSPLSMFIPPSNQPSPSLTGQVQRNKRPPGSAWHTG
jgi:hypothetical protein